MSKSEKSQHRGKRLQLNLLHAFLKSGLDITDARFARNYLPSFIIFLLYYTLLYLLKDHRHVKI